LLIEATSNTSIRVFITTIVSVDKASSARDGRPGRRLLAPGIMREIWSTGEFDECASFLAFLFLYRPTWYNVLFSLDIRCKREI
jgi:hypothetical protein